MKRKPVFITFVIVVLLAICFINYYVTLPAINIHNPSLWWFILFILAIFTVGTFIRSSRIRETKTFNVRDIKENFKTTKVFKISLILTVLCALIFMIGSFLSSPIINAGKYCKLIDIADGDFGTDIQQISYEEIPLLDRDSAQIIGARKMVTMVEYVSQFEVSDDYTQINYQNKPVRVTPLEYGSILKWFTNRSEGIPAYIMIDMATQNTDCIKLSEGIKYSKSEHFGRLIYRYLRFRYPTYIFDDLNMEIDESGVPYWICPVKDYTIGLFGGETIARVVTVNAITGECENYDVDEVPAWIDHVYSADLLIGYYNYYGTLTNGYFNSILSQKGCLKTTEGYNYIAKDDDVWVYTGVTSVGGDESNVGFVLMNQRTKKTLYYQVPGAEEFSAMESAEGKVQNLGYVATFPLLLNISGEPTYFMSLKDSAGLVKMYAMVNIQKYTLVATANTVEECEKQYKEMLISNKILSDSSEDENQTDNLETETVSGVISSITQAVINGNSHFYVTLDNKQEIYDVDINGNVKIVTYKEGDNISFEYVAGDDVNKVVTIK